MPALKMLSSDGPWQIFDLGESGHLLGRHPALCDVILTDPGKTVSRQHAELIWEDGAYFVVDHSQAGTHVNDRRLSRGYRYRLKDGDVIRICNYVFAYVNVTDDSDVAPGSVILTDDGSSGLSQALSLSTSTRRAKLDPAAQLAAITQVTRTLRGSNSLREAINNALDSMLQLFHVAYRGVVVLVDSQGVASAPPYVRHRPDEEVTPANASSAMILEFATRKTAGVSADQLTLGAAILNGEDECLAVILFQSRGRPGTFQEQDLEVLATVAIELGFVFENYLLQENALRLRQLQFDLNIATEVQLGLLPTESPRIPGYQFYEHYRSARQVGGDYYDYVKCGPATVAVALGDVSGKGVPAALLMARIASEARLLLEEGLEPGPVLEKLNIRLNNRRPRDGDFVTMLLALLNVETHSLQLVNAGHLRPLVRSGSSVRELDEVGEYPLGVAPVVEYTDATFQIESGDVLVFYTDGVIDARNEAKQLYGSARLRETLANTNGSAESTGRQIIDDVRAFIGEEPRADDICVVCVSRD